MSYFITQCLHYCLACVLALGPHTARTDDRFAGMDSYIRAAMEYWQIPGLAIAVVKDGEMVLARGYGVCEVGEERQVTADTTFTIASCSKSFMAACLGILVEEGKLAWDDPVVKHLPDFELSDRYLTEHVTLRDLLCQRTGLQRCDPLCDGAGFEVPQIMRRLKYIPLAADLRTRLTYDLESLAALLMFDVFDAYLVGPETAWDQDNWKSTWVKNEPPGGAYRPRDEAKARLEASRVPGTRPSQPLEQYAGVFDSNLYGRLTVRHESRGLSVTFGGIYHGDVALAG